ncbi:MAG: hypothetical protein JNK41_04805, partial [Saprospiraceae bacterium]|nr:hypothetical protein [Saprospiraceae bacterium]
MQNSIKSQIYGWSKSYEIYPATENALRFAVFDDTLVMNSFCSCYVDDACSFITKLDTAGNIIKTKEFHKVGKPIQLGSLSNILKTKTGYCLTGDDSWDNDTSKVQTQHFYQFSNNLDTIKRTYIPTLKNLSQYGVNLVFYPKDSIYTMMALKEITKNPYTYKINVTAIDKNESILWQYDYFSPKYKFNTVGDIIKNTDTSMVISLRVGAWRIHYFSLNLKGQLLWEYTEDEGQIDGLIDPSTFLPLIADLNGKDIVRTWYVGSLLPSGNDALPEISRLSYNGNKKWTTLFTEYFGGPGFFPNTKANKIIEPRIQQFIKAKNGDYLGVGYAFVRENHWTNGLPNYECGFAFRIDSNGVMKWQRLYVDLEKEKFGPMLLFNIAEADDGAIYLSGEIRDSIPNVPGSTLNGNIWLIKVGPDGCITPGCTDTVLKVATTKLLNQHPHLLSVFPNPGSDKVTIGWNDVPSPPKTLEIRTMAGQLIRSDHIDGNGGNATIDVSYLQG